MLLISNASGLGEKPLKDRMWIEWILRIISPNKLHLLQIRTHIPSLVIKESLRFAFGRESLNRCLLLSLYLFFGRPFLFLLWCTESLVEIGELFLQYGVTRDKIRDRIWVELCWWWKNERIVTCLFFEHNTAQLELLLRVCCGCVVLRVLATKSWKIVCTWSKCCLWSRDEILLSWRLLVKVVVICHFWTLCLMMLNEFARFLVG